MRKKSYILQLHLITTSEELKEELLNIESEKISASKKRNKKITLLKTQIKIRRKILNQNIPIVFTNNRKQRPTADIAKELCDFIDKSTLPTESAKFIKDPMSLVGKRIKHKFKDEDSGDLQWYYGTILDYSDEEKTYCIAYKGEDDQYHYDLILDLLIGDLVVL